MELQNAALRLKKWVPLKPTPHNAIKKTMFMADIILGLFFLRYMLASLTQDFWSHTDICMTITTVMPEFLLVRAGH